MLPSTVHSKLYAGNHKRDTYFSQNHMNILTTLCHLFCACIWTWLETETRNIVTWSHLRVFQTLQYLETIPTNRNCISGKNKTLEMSIIIWLKYYLCFVNKTMKIIYKTNRCLCWFVCTRNMIHFTLWKHKSCLQ